jgi:hypothetical protein
LPVQDWSFSSSLAVVALFQVDSAVAAVVVGAVAAAVEENEVFNFRLHLQTFIRFRIKPRSCRMQ